MLYDMSMRVGAVAFVSVDFVIKMTEDDEFL